MFSQLPSKLVVTHCNRLDDASQEKPSSGKARESDPGPLSVLLQQR